MNKKGQFTIENAPMIILIVGLTFLMMATLAFVGENYGTAIEDTASGTTYNETGSINSTGYTLEGGYKATSFSITTATNASDGTVIASGNYTVSNSGVVTNASSAIYPNTNFTYTYKYNTGTAAFNVTEDLSTEIEGNTSIAGIVLTISLVGIVLTVLIGVFVGFRRRI